MEIHVGIKVYLAYSKADYNTDYEKELIAKIKALYLDTTDEDIFNPKTVVMSEEDKKKDLIFQEWKYYCPLMNEAYVIVAAKCHNDIVWKGRYTPGVKWEIGYARRTGKIIVELDENLEVMGATSCS